ncbi:hypothetical protein GUITHDRAFT_153005 [Guillardia theta CCMP2712]|uniref:Thioredoxin domain-containing protein n=1 Tax=Guillardia theta (strain CCMP2712) TaxID=905079 RepID=L1J6X0_GUITC|nr:hypothetical protein GUITHDRAFT_153005 [Guillardia theta CCMP2712]EKX44266.1 hypothetical protein GUITHDRAFT_153005 [Guillardia theta CCMP2712]|eukprot:XP_005831246.1 hypothetical protein GUITHDRAFT_153005 [Guillardia theta CCMP2712]
MAEVADRSLPLAILFVELETTPQIWSYMSLLFQEVFQFAVVPKSNDLLCELYTIETFPAMIVIGVNDKEVHRYEGDVDYSSVSLWLSDVSVRMD